MHKKSNRLVLFTLLFLVPCTVLAQQDRIQLLQKRLDSLAKTVPGLNQKVQLQVVGGTIQQYLLGISSSNNLSISVDPKLNFSINDAFNDVTASNILIRSEEQ